jgi:hypothetical protein
MTKRTLLFHTIATDTINLTGATSYPIFADTSEGAPTIREKTEGQALKWLFCNPLFKNEFSQKFFPNATNVRHYLGLQAPFTKSGDKPGDIDVLLVNPEIPHQAVAFEAKRLKIETSEDGTIKINRAGEIAHGICQANHYLKLGFHRNYLLMILLDDGRAQKARYTLMRFASGRPVDEIFSIPWVEALDSDVGVIYIRINQTIDKSIDDTYIISYCIDKEAKRQVQTDEMTNKIRSMK